MVSAPSGYPKLAMAQQMCAQMADAITAFLAPRVQETRPSPDHERGWGPVSQRTDLEKLRQDFAEVEPATMLQANGTGP